jgi:hypothetical protein
VISQREADLSLLISVYSRSMGRDLLTKLPRVRNSFTAGAYMTGAQFESAVETLKRFEMIELDSVGGEPAIKISDHGAKWLMENFHWVRGDRDSLQPNDENWVMTSPDSAASAGNRNSGLNN